jgi:hypothetical protein
MITTKVIRTSATRWRFYRHRRGLPHSAVQHTYTPTHQSTAHTLRGSLVRFRNRRSVSTVRCAADSSRCVVRLWTLRGTFFFRSRRFFPFWCFPRSVACASVVTLVLIIFSWPCENSLLCCTRRAYWRVLERNFRTCEGGTLRFGEVRMW